MLSIWQMISGCDWGERDKRNIPDDERLLVMQDRLIAEERENVAEAAEGIRILAKREGKKKKKRGRGRGRGRREETKCNPREKARFPRPNRSRLAIGASGRRADTQCRT